MHGTQQGGVTRTHGAGKDPPRRLELVNPAETLQPDRVEELTLARLTGPILGDLYVAIEGIGDEVDLAEALRRVDGATRPRRRPRHHPLRRRHQRAKPDSSRVGRSSSIS